MNYGQFRLSVIHRILNEHLAPSEVADVLRGSGFSGLDAEADQLELAGSDWGLHDRLTRRPAVGPEVTRAAAHAWGHEF